MGSCFHICIQLARKRANEPWKGVAVDLSFLYGTIVNVSCHLRQQCCTPRWKRLMGIMTRGQLPTLHFHPWPSTRMDLLCACYNQSLQQSPLLAYHHDGPGLNFLLLTEQKRTPHIQGNLLIESITRSLPIVLAFFFRNKWSPWQNENASNGSRARSF